MLYDFVCSSVQSTGAGCLAGSGPDLVGLAGGDGHPRDKVRESRTGDTAVLEGRRISSCETKEVL